ncbi:CoA ester lyase [SAR202 cluster bacterium AD-804-J14_MRT_500m]|nr:CoA ester lyase [SAR202 cluster bacterium AD-804-J14_MRT_500m]
MELIRSLQFVPGNRRDMLEKARTFNADVLVVDLEDSVPIDQKFAARTLVAEIAPSLSENKQKVAVRLNSLDTGLTSIEIDTIIGFHIFAISIGKINSPWHIQQCDFLLNAAENRLGIPIGSVKIIPWIESASAILEAKQISLASPRVIALAFGAEDYTYDMGVQRTDLGDEMKFARSLVPLAARAAGIVALDTPYVQFKDHKGLTRETREAVTLGYKGKFSIHPGQLDTINQIFSPTQIDIDYAKRVVNEWEIAEAQGKGSLSIDNRMIDIPVVKRAKALLGIVDQIKWRCGSSQNHTESL